MKDIKYKYTRLYDFCVDDDAKPGNRAFKKKERIYSGVIIFIIGTISFVYPLIKSWNPKLWYVIVLYLYSMGFLLYITRLGPISLTNLLLIKKLEKKQFKSLLESVILSHNIENYGEKYFSLENFKGFGYSLNWCKIKMIFRDKRFQNEYYFIISTNRVVYKLKLSKKAKAIIKKSPSKFISKKEIYDEQYFRNSHTIKEFYKNILDIYLDKRERIFSVLNVNSNNK